MCDSEYDDPVVAEIREIREQISAEFGHDPTRYLEYLRERQTRDADLLVSYTDEGDAKVKNKPAV